MSNATLISRAVVNSFGGIVRVVMCSGERWVVARDIALCVLLNAGAVGARVKMSPEVLAGHYRKARIEGMPVESLLLSEGGVRWFIDGLKTKDNAHAEELIAWLDRGGMRAVTEPPASTANLVTLKAIPSRPPACQIERRKAYCRELLKTLMRYTSEEEAEELVQVIEGEVRNLLSHRHCPGLNDARYDVYRRFWLQGGDV